MNTIGKILVILNFLFAIIVGIVMVMVIGLRTQWKDAYKELETQSKVVVAQRDAATNMNRKLVNDYRSAKLERDEIAQLRADDKTVAALKEKADEEKIKQFENQAIAAQNLLQQALSTNKRMAAEITVLNQSITDRESLIVKLQADINVVRVQAQNFESLARARQLQNEGLLEKVRELTRQYALREAGVNPDALAIRDPNAPNPPAVAVNGRIEMVDAKDNTLIQISLGTDHGVHKNHTLDVYRTKPEAKYLGMIRILEAYHQRSVAQLVTSGNTAYRPPLRPDDLVASKLR